MQKPTKYTLLLFATFIVSSIIHNLIYAVFSTEEPVFFIIGIIAFLVFWVFVLFFTVKYIKTKKPADWWKVGWLGLFGLLAILPGFSTKLFGFFAFFSLFGFKK